MPMLPTFWLAGSKFGDVYQQGFKIA